MEPKKRKNPVWDRPEERKRHLKARDRNFRRQRIIANQQIKEQGQRSYDLYKSRGMEEEFWALRDEIRARGVHHLTKVYDKEGNLIPLIDFENKPFPTSKFSRQLSREICSRIVQGETLKAICADEEMPALTTIRAWYKKYPEFTRQLDEAYTERADYYVDQLYDLMKDVKEGVLDPKKASFVADQIKWMAERLNPKYLNKRNDSPINVNVDGEGKVNFQILLHNPSNQGLLNGPESPAGGSEQGSDS